MQWRIVVKDGRIVEVEVVVGVKVVVLYSSATGRHTIPLTVSCARINFWSKGTCTSSTGYGSTGALRLPP